MMFVLQLVSLQNSNFTTVFIAAIVVILLLIAIAFALTRRQKTHIKSLTKSEKSSEKKKSKGVTTSRDSYQHEAYAGIAGTGKLIETRDIGFKIKSPQNTTTIVKGNINVPTVKASQNQADKVHDELVHLPLNTALTLNETMMDEETTAAKIYDVKKSLDSDVPLSSILASCIDIARSLDRTNDTLWMECESFGAYEWRTSAIVDATDGLIFPEYRLINGKMYLNYKKEGESHSTIEEYDVPIFESRPVYLLEKAVLDAQSKNADYIVFNAPTPLQWPSVASLGEFVPVSIDIRDYKIILREIKRRIYDFMAAIQ
jgi:hypothetical protein